MTRTNEAPNLYARHSVEPREARIRRALAKHGCALRKSRVRTPHAHDLGDYMIADIDHNAVVAGERFDWTLNDVETWLSEDQAIAS
ncbi:MAG TPA: hypothetical protein VGR16_12445 [Thermomicrobiales bacterium]|nr:hypothetical protein [Thermomicrobiales bacterium]